MPPRGGPAFAFEMSGAPAAASAAYAMLRRGGLVVAAGLPDAKQTFSVPIAAMVSDERELRAATWEAAFRSAISRCS